jgi:hypothetical protein
LLYGGSIPPEDLRAAADSTVGEVEALSKKFGVDTREDANFSSVSPSSYAAICVISGELARSLGQQRIVMYQFEDPGRSNLVTAY